MADSRDFKNERTTIRESWISVKDKWPEIGQLVVFLRDTGDRFIPNVTYWNLEDERYSGPSFNNVTHWMPLPPPPTDKQDKP